MFGTNSWTIEMWAYITSYTNGGALFEVNQRNGNGFATLMFFYLTNRTFYSSDNGSTWNRFNAIGTGMTAITSQWTHWCVSMEYPMLRMFQNGNLTYSYQMSSPFSIPTSGYTYIGARGANGIGAGPSLNMQDIRFSSCARYTANFTPPTRFI
jgi:hypothetical protein